MSVANPYNPLYTAGEELPFVGREDVFSFFRQHLVGAPLTHGLVLIGRRGLGKTALLHQLDRQIDERYRLCLVPLGDLDLSSEGRLLEALVGAIHATLEAAGASTYRVPEWPETSPEGVSPGLRAWFKTDFLSVVMSALRLRHLLLAFDDAHLLFEAIDRGTLPQDLFAYWADLLATYERLALVFALDAVYEDRVLTTELLSNPALHLRLAELPREDAERLIREPVAGLLQLDPQTVEGILTLADGHPFLLHSVCRLLFRRSEERNHAGPITPHDLAAIRADHATRPRGYSRGSAGAGRRDFAPVVATSDAERTVYADRPGESGRTGAGRSLLVRCHTRLVAWRGLCHEQDATGRRPARAGL